MQEKNKILIVDDRPENLIALEVLLQDFNVEIVKAYSGNEALKLTLEHDFALVLMDVQMPEMDGYETVNLMHKVERTRYLPVIFISAIYSETQYILNKVEADAVDFLSKPINPKILKGKVRVFLDLQNQKKALEQEIEKRKQSENKLKNTQQSLRIAKQKAEESDALKTNFLANMSHEIRTPMNAIIGFANLLANSELKVDERNTYIQYIKNSSNALLALIDDIIDISKIEAGQLKIVLRKLEVNPLLKELHATFLEEAERKEKGELELILEIPKNISELKLETDEFRFRQIFTNLVGNALKFTLEGTIRFGYYFAKEENSVVFFVKDTGIGIESNQTDLIFERFEQIKNKDIDNQKGTGLGLAITKKIVELLGGEIWVESVVNVGSEFYFSFPLIESSVIKQNQQAENKPETEKKDAISGNLTNKIILIAEDELINYLYVKEVLRNTGAVLIWAKNGQEAVDVFNSRNDIDLILMDLKMPVLTGKEAMQIIKNTNNNIPVIAQTAYAMAGEKETNLKYGFDDYITKPIKPEILIETIEHFLSKVQLKN